MPLISTAAMHTSSQIWNLIELAIANGRKLGEETLTELFLLHLTTLTTGSLLIRDFGKKEEFRNGADWAWWFIDASGRGLGFRVQAKVMQQRPPRPSTQPNYEQLHYAPRHGATKRSFAKGHQTLRLIRAARVARMLPVYCLYTHFDATFTPTGRCQFKGHWEEGFGVSVVGAHHILALHHTQTTLDTFFDHVHAFPCMLLAFNTLEDLAAYAQGRWPLVENLEERGFIHTAEEVQADPLLSLAVYAEDDSNVVLPPSLDRLTVFRLLS